MVAGGVFTVFDKHLTLVVTFRYLAGEETLVLLSIYARDETLFCLEVKSHGVALVGVATHDEYRCTEDIASSVLRASGMHEAAVEIHVYLVALEVHVLILHARVTVEVSQARCPFVCERVLGFIFHGRVDAVLTFSVDAVEGQRVVDSLIMMINSQLERVHQCSVRTRSQGAVNSSV